MRRPYDGVKRIFDAVVASLLLLVSSPALIAAALLVWRNLGRPVLFRQERPGKDGRLFRMLKLRTMIESRDQSDRLLTDEERLTRFGRWLRATSLDELPTLWNVVRGEMSLVGPRPLLVEYLTLYSAEQARRHEVRPGITGWAQIHGRNELDWPERLALDVWYVDHRSFRLDLKILLLTIPKVWRREGISAQGEATMKAFAGGAGGGLGKVSASRTATQRSS
jgi:sugar transferase EpsL